MGVRVRVRVWAGLGLGLGLGRTWRGEAVPLSAGLVSAASARASACRLLAVRCRPLSGDEVRPPPPFSSYEFLRSELRLSGEEPALFVPDGEDPPLDLGEVSFVSRFRRAWLGLGLGLGLTLPLALTRTHPWT